MASNGTFIASSTGSSVSFWDTTTGERIGSIEYTHHIWSMAISSNYDLVASGDKKTTLRALCSILPSRLSLRLLYNASLSTSRSLVITNPSIGRCSPPTCRKSSTPRLKKLTKVHVHSLAPLFRFWHQCLSDERIANLEETIQQLRNQLAESRNDSIGGELKCVPPLHSLIFSSFASTR